MGFFYFMKVTKLFLELKRNSTLKLDGKQNTRQIWTLRNRSETRTTQKFLTPLSSERIIVTRNGMS